MGYQPPAGIRAPQTTGESLLVVAVLQQAWADVQSANPLIRYDAERFWGNAESIRPWADILDLDVQALTEAVVRVRQAL